MRPIALVRPPARSFAKGITTARLGPPDYEKALTQHQLYCDALRQCGLELIVLEADERYPDACFVEDTAVVTEEVAILCRPGEPSRRAEVASVAAVLAEYKPLTSIEPPGTVDGGDVLRVRDYFYIGRSARTNAEGARQLATILSRSGYRVAEIPVNSVLHLKTGVTYIGKNTLVVIDEFLKYFPSAGLIKVGAAAGPANCLLANRKAVLMPAGYPKVKQKITELGHAVIEVEMSEFRKMDGGLSCLSLIF